jgi:D-methionine transport system ATP-binding protein
MSEEAPAIELIDADIPRVRATAPIPLLRDVTWRINRGEFWALGGTPGAGKTDLLSTAAALQRPLKGYHLLFGRDIGQMDEQELVVMHRQVGMVFDSGRLFTHLTITENLALPLAYHADLSKKEIAERVERVLEATGLQGVGQYQPREITRHLHQRVGLARALALEPEVLVIDSPLLGVDPRLGRWWLDFLCALHKGHPLLGKRPLTIVVSTDDFLPWNDVAARFAIIKESGVAIIGGREDLRQNQETAVRELLTPAFQD